MTAHCLRYERIDHDVTARAIAEKRRRALIQASVDVSDFRVDRRQGMRAKVA